MTPEQVAGLTISFPSSSSGGRVEITVTVQIVDVDGRPLNSTESLLSVVFNRANTAPRFNGGRPTLNGVTARNGLRVRSLLVGALDFEQPNSGAAIVGLSNVGRGKWQYKTTGAWRSISGRVSDRRALLLPPTARLRFAPAAGAAPGKLIVKLRAWDQTSGRATTFTPAAPFGGSTAFSSTVRNVGGTLARSAVGVGFESNRSADEPSDRRILDAELIDAAFAASVED
ncbi:MAG: hypothetical protein ACRDD1_15875 [Planctomycetia bacterium]